MVSSASIVCSSGSALFELEPPNRLCTPPACASGFTCSFNHSSDSQTVIIIKSEFAVVKKGNRKRTGFVWLRVQRNCRCWPCQIDLQYLSIEFVHIHIVNCILGIGRRRIGDESESSMFWVYIVRQGQGEESDSFISKKLTVWIWNLVVLRGGGR